MAACALLGGISPANAMLGAVHSLAGVVGGMAGVPHGIAALLALVIEANVRALRPGRPAVDRYDRAARLLTGQPAASIQDGLA
jgi:alcohol dehydrogenase class IV